MRIQYAFILCILMFFSYKLYVNCNQPVVHECCSSDLSNINTDDDVAYKYIKNSLFNTDAKTYMICPRYSRKVVYGFAIIYSYDKLEKIKTQNTFIPNEIYNVKIDSFSQIEYMYVLPRHRKKGLGSMLLQKCKSFGKQKEENVHIKIHGQYINMVINAGFSIDSYNNNTDIYDCVFEQKNYAIV